MGSRLKAPSKPSITVTKPIRPRESGACFFGDVMTKFDTALSACADDLRDNCQIVPDMDLLAHLARALGPALFLAQQSTITAADPTALAAVVAGFMARHGLSPDAAPEMTRAVIDAYPSTGPRHRAVVQYLICQNYGLKSSVLAG